MGELIVVLSGIFLIFAVAALASLAAEIRALRREVRTWQRYTKELADWLGDADPDPDPGTRADLGRSVVVTLDRRRAA